MADLQLKAGDTAPPVAATFTTKTGATVVLTGATVQFRMRAIGAAIPVVNAAASIVDAALGKVQYTWQAGDTAVAGDYSGEFVVTYADATIQRVPTNGAISISIIAPLT